LHISCPAVELLPQDFERPLEPALHGIHRDIKNLRDVRQFQLFLVAKYDHGTGIFGEGSHHTLQPPGEQRVDFRGLRHRFRDIFQTRWRSLGQLPNFVNLAAAGYLAKPEDQMISRLDRVQVAIKTKENILRYLFRSSPVMQKVVGDAEHHGLVFLHEVPKGRGVTPYGTGQRFLALR